VAFLPNSCLFEQAALKRRIFSAAECCGFVFGYKDYNGSCTTLTRFGPVCQVITLMGSHFASRAASGALAAVGLPELITEPLKNMSVGGSSCKFSA